MKFSDDEIKRLKIDMDRLGDFPVGNYRLRPLLARLEAAENHIRSLDKLSTKGQDKIVLIEILVTGEAWRKTCGK